MLYRKTSAFGRMGRIAAICSPRFIPEADGRPGDGWGRLMAGVDEGSCAGLLDWEVSERSGSLIDAVVQVSLNIIFFHERFVTIVRCWLASQAGNEPPCEVRDEFLPMRS